MPLGPSCRTSPCLWARGTQCEPKGGAGPGLGLGLQGAAGPCAQVSHVSTPAGPRGDGGCPEPLPPPEAEHSWEESGGWSVVLPFQRSLCVSALTYSSQHKLFSV